MFTKLHVFDIDCDRLYREWELLAQQLEQQGRGYSRINIVYTEPGVDDWKKIVIGAAPIRPLLTRFNARNIIAPFVGSYTEQVVAQVEQFLNQLNLRSTRVKYAALDPGAVLQTHRDAGYDYRYHLVIRSNDQCSMTVDEVSYALVEREFSKMQASLPHSAYNHGNQTRLLMTFDVEDLKPSY